MKPYILKDKLNRIYAIVKNSSTTTPEEFKETLNHFRGRQLTKETIRECLEYLKYSLNHNQDKLTEIHKSWNNKYF